MGESVLPSSLLLYSLSTLCFFHLYTFNLLFTDQKKKKKKIERAMQEVFFRGTKLGVEEV